MSLHMLKRMSYKQVKWLILLIPTFTVGIWEYVRHEFLLAYITMEQGNWLTPMIVFAVTMIFLLKLFQMLESMQEELRQERGYKSALEERERIARELHDGIAQSLFLLSVKMNQLKKAPELGADEDFQRMEKTLQHLYEDVRQSIQNLRQEPSPDELPWTASLHRLIDQFRMETDVELDMQWSLPEQLLSPKEKVELYACMKEALMNVRKHSRCDRVWVRGEIVPEGWVCTVMDDGIGFNEEELLRKNGYGLQLMKDRAEEMGWKLDFSREESKTVVRIIKG